MKVASSIDVPDWMGMPEIKTLWAALNDDGVDAPQTLFVGGCVRNALLGEAVTDIDLATTYTPDEVTARLTAAGIKVIPTGIDHGTVTAVIGKKSFEITTLRKDVETDGRHAVVSFSIDWQEDAQRRDFTMNTLLADMQGNVYDPTGQGLDDLKARKVRFVGAAKDRIAEDYLRVLRYFRFQALYGEGEADSAILTECKDAAPYVEELSRERITQEMFKIIMVDKPDGILRIMRDNSILPALFDLDRQDLSLLGHLAQFQGQYEAEQLSARLLVLAAFDLAQLISFERYLLVPKVIFKDAKLIIGALGCGAPGDEQTLKVALYKYGRTATMQALMIALARDEVNNKDASAALGIIQGWDIPDFPMSGDDLIKEGYKPGPDLGAELSRREDMWIKGGFGE